MSFSPWLLRGDRNSLIYSVWGFGLRHVKRMPRCRVVSPAFNKRMKMCPRLTVSPLMRVAYRVVEARWVSSSFSRPSTEMPRFSLLLDSRGVIWKVFSSVELAFIVSLGKVVKCRNKLTSLYFKPHLKLNNDKYFSSLSNNNLKQFRDIWNWELIWSEIIFLH